MRKLIVYIEFEQVRYRELVDLLEEALESAGAFAPDGGKLSWCFFGSLEEAREREESSFKE